MPSATKNLFEKRFLDFQKLLIGKRSALTPKSTLPARDVIPLLDAGIFDAGLNRIQVRARSLKELCKGT